MVDIIFGHDGYFSYAIFYVEELSFSGIIIGDRICMNKL